ncbi:hypothetical protein [Frateuria defendens]|uniref:hypothetical protein n=1 Tax=Frateuria defendens TaxID=2219559 RepID=UPI001F4412B5|nr:hypothetical protein [Frateuria defendens]
MDKSSLDKMYFGGSEADLKAYRALMEKLKLTSPTDSPVISLDRVAQIGYGHFDAVYVPGDHAPMQDLLHSAELGKLLANFHGAARARPPPSSATARSPCFPPSATRRTSPASWRPRAAPRRSSPGSTPATASP